MRPTIVDNDHQINLWLLSWAFLIRSPSRIWAVSESSLFDFGSIFEPFSATNHARIGQSTLFVHEDDDGLLLSPEENTIAEHAHVHSRRKWTDDERMVYWCLPRRTPLLSMHARACISAITPNTCSTAQLPPPPQPTPPSPRPSPPAPRPLSPPPPWVARRPIASFIRFFWCIATTAQRRFRRCAPTSRNGCINLQGTILYGTTYSPWEFFFYQQVLKLGANEASAQGLQNAL